MPRPSRSNHHISYMHLRPLPLKMRLGTRCVSRRTQADRTDLRTKTCVHCFATSYCPRTHIFVCSSCDLVHKIRPPKSGHVADIFIGHMSTRRLVQPIRGIPTASRRPYLKANASGERG